MIPANVIAFIAKNWKTLAVVGIIVLNVAFAGTAYGFFRAYQNSKYELANAERVINAKIDEIQSFDQKLGIAESDLRRQKDLTEAYEDEIKEFRRELQQKTDKIDAKDLEIASRDETIAKLQGVVKKGSGTTTVTVVTEKPDENGGTTTFETVVDVKEVCDGKTLAYKWQDEHERFKLDDPDIGNSGDETFTYSQLVRIKGLVLTDETGDVQVKKVTAEEVIASKDANGDVVYLPVENGAVSLVDSKFEYVNKPPKEKGFDWLAPITLRPVVGFDTALTPNIGIEVVNLGRWIPYANIGVVPKFAPDFSGLPNGDFTTLQNSRLGVGLVYHLVPPLVDTNVGIGISMTTPFHSFGSQWVFTADLTFYMTQDLFPF